MITLQAIPMSWPSKTTDASRAHAFKIRNVHAESSTPCDIRLGYQPFEDAAEGRLMLPDLVALEPRDPRTGCQPMRLRWPGADLDESLPALWLAWNWPALRRRMSGRTHGGTGLDLRGRVALRACLEQGFDPNDEAGWVSFVARERAAESEFARLPLALAVHLAAHHRIYAHELARMPGPLVARVFEATFLVEDRHLAALEYFRSLVATHWAHPMLSPFEPAVRDQLLAPTVEAVYAYFFLLHECMVPRAAEEDRVDAFWHELASYVFWAGRTGEALVHIHAKLTPHHVDMQTAPSEIADFIRGTYMAPA